MNHNNERDILNKVAQNSLYTTLSNKTMIEYCFGIFKRHLRNGSILEMGPAEGTMTEYLSRCSDDLTLLEGSDIFTQNLKQQFPNAKVINEFFELYKPNKKFDNIVLGH